LNNNNNINYLNKDIINLNNNDKFGGNSIDENRNIQDIKIDNVNINLNKMSDINQSIRNNNSFNINNLL